MSLGLSFAFLAVGGIQLAYAMDCTLGTSENAIEQFIQTCPRPLIDSKEDSYCCWSSDSKIVDCCNLNAFVFNSISILMPLIIIVLVVSFIVSCICCLSRSLYKQMSGGRVLRQGPMVVSVGPYAMPPATPYQPLSDGRNGWTVA